jgi:hypothetical protein
MKSFIFKLIAQTVVLFAFIAAALFISAGTIRWVEAWLFFGSFLVFFIGVSLWLFRINPSLANERMRLGGSNQQGWDRILFPIMFISPLAWLVLSGLDSMRFKWSHVPLWVEVIGGVLLIISFCLFFLTFRENSYLSPLARVQRDRGQKVISTGPYAIIRGYCRSWWMKNKKGHTLRLQNNPTGYRRRIVCPGRRLRQLRQKLQQEANWTERLSALLAKGQGRYFKPLWKWKLRII